MPLEQRRFIADVTFLYKVLNGYVNIDFSSFLNFYCPDDRDTFRSFDCLKLGKTLLELPVLKTHTLTELWIAGTVYRVKFALVMIYTHLGAVLRGFWVGLVIFSLSVELPGLVDLSHCA